MPLALRCASCPPVPYARKKKGGKEKGGGKGERVEQNFLGNPKGGGGRPGREICGRGGRDDHAVVAGLPKPCRLAIRVREKGGKKSGRRLGCRRHN